MRYLHVEHYVVLRDIFFDHAHHILRRPLYRLRLEVVMAIHGKERSRRRSCMAGKGGAWAEPLDARAVSMPGTADRATICLALQTGPRSVWHSRQGHDLPATKGLHHRTRNLNGAASLTSHQHCH